MALHEAFHHTAANHCFLETAHVLEGGVHLVLLSPAERIRVVLNDIDALGLFLRLNKGSLLELLHLALGSDIGGNGKHTTGFGVFLNTLRVDDRWNVARSTVRAELVSRVHIVELVLRTVDFPSI